MTSVIAITKEKTAKIIPNAVGVSTNEETHMFSSLLSREATFKVSGGVSLWTVTLFFTALQGDHLKGEGWHFMRSGDTLFSSLLSREAIFKVSSGVSLASDPVSTAPQGDHLKGERWACPPMRRPTCSPPSSPERPLSR
jgi:hypothetical protein